MLTRWLRTLLMAGFAGWLSGCGGGGTAAPPAAALAITVQPASQQVTAPGAAGFDVTVSGSPSTYQWQLCADANPICATWSDIAGATSASYSTGATALAMTGQRYQLVASNSAGSVTSATVVLTVNPAPVAATLALQPVDQAVTAGSAASFTVVATGTPMPTLQWQRSTDNGATWVDIAAATASTYNTGPATLSQSGERYRAVASNSAGNATSNAVQLTVNPAAQAPAITTQPGSQSVTAPSSATFSATASGVPTPTWQWQLSTDAGSTWVDINGATSASYTTPATTVADSGHQYHALASNSAGTASSTVATLTVTASAPAAASWQTASLIEVDNLGDAAGPQIAFNSAGDGMAVWHQFDGTRNNIWANRYVAATGWGTATLIESDPGDAALPQVAIDANGNATAVWQQRDVNGRNNIWANRYLVGAGWGAPVAIETNGPSAGDDQLARIAMDGNGNAIVVWELSSFSSTTIWANRHVVGTGWATAIQIGSGNPNGNHVTPQVAMDAAGNAFVAWTQYNGSITNVWGNRFVAGAGWGTAGSVQSDSTSSGRDPRIAADSSGTAIAVWAQFDVTTSTDHIWASRYVGGTGWGSATLIQTGNPTHQSNLPKIAFDASGNAIAVWNQGAFGSFSIYAARYVAGAGWGTEAVIETHTVGSGAASVSLGVDSAGNALAVWQLTDASSFTDIWATRYTVGAGWGTATQIEPGNLRTGQAFNPQIAMNGNGQAIAVWQRRNPTRYDIWANDFR
jgi:hypothetical protein